MAEKIVEDPALGCRYGFDRVPGPGGDEILQVRCWVQPGAGVPPHVHPELTETFEVLEGEVTFLKGSDEVRLKAGESVVVPPGVRHRFRNATSTPVSFKTAVDPPHPDLQNFLEDSAAVGRAGGYTSKAIPKSVGAALRLALMGYAYRDTTLIDLPVPGAQRYVLPFLARLGERRGYRARRFAEDLGV